MRATLTRFSPLLFTLCLAGCGQTGPLFMRMPLTAIPMHWSPPPIGTAMTPIVAMPGDTAMAPVGATVVPPAAATHPSAAPAPGTHATPGASTHAGPAR